MPSSSILSGQPKGAAYAAPRLKIYGDAKALTASGTGTQNEGGPPGNCNIDIGKKPC